MKQKTWILIFAGVCVLCLVLWLLPQKTAASAAVYQDGALLYTLDLSEDRTLVVTGPAGENEITVAGGEIRVTHADCPDQVCVAHGPLSDTGGPIVCLPNRLTIQWLQPSQSVDAVTGTGGLR